MLLALAVHAAVFGLAVVSGAFDALIGAGGAHSGASSDGAGGDLADDRPIELQNLVEELKEPDARSSEEARREEEKKKQEDNPDQSGQVVDIPRPAIEERPDEHARFLSEYDSRVAKETRGRVGRDKAGGGADEVAALERHSSPGARPTSSRAPGMPGSGSRATGQGGSLGQGGNSTELTPDGDQRRAGAPGLPGAGSDKGERGEGGLPGERGPDQPNLQPSEDMLARAIARGTGSPDYLQDVDDGEATALNAKKFTAAPFFNRVKRAVADQWHPDLVYVRHDPSGNVYGSKDRVTVLRVNLEPDGRLKNVTVLQPSGVEFLDDEAIEAFRRAQPFPNPPPRLVSSDGVIHFSFGFIFELSGHTSFKVLKYQ